MPIIIKSPEEVELMRKSGKILASVLDEVKNFSKEGMSTYEVNEFAEKLIEKHGVKAGFKGYNGFPAALCTSINEEVVHTIPSKDKVLKNGDIFTVDCGVVYKGFNSDSAFTMFIGDVSPLVVEFVHVVKKAMFEAINKLKPGVNLNVIGDTIQKMVEGKHGYSIIKELTGHGIGRKLHEDPLICNHKQPTPGPVLEEGMTFAIEPIAAMGSGAIDTLNDHWTIITQDKMPACQWEHTVLITKDSVEILTQ